MRGKLMPHNAHTITYTNRQKRETKKGTFAQINVKRL